MRSHPPEWILQHPDLVLVIELVLIDFEDVVLSLLDSVFEQLHLGMDPPQLESDPTLPWCCGSILGFEFVPLLKLLLILEQTQRNETLALKVVRLINVLVHDKHLQNLVTFEDVEGKALFPYRVQGVLVVLRLARLTSTLQYHVGV